MQKSNLPAVILAGGKSSRMGQDKALLPFKNKSSLALFQYERLQKLFTRVYISTKKAKFDFKAPLILDQYPAYSPLSAIVSIYETLQSDFFLIAVDMPLVSKEEIKRLLHSFYHNGGFELYCFYTTAYEPTVAIYTQSFYMRAKKALEHNFHKLNTLFKQSNTFLLIPKTQKTFININTRQEYKKFFQ